MNTKILQKCIDALSTTEPDLSYIRGMLETLLELTEKPLENKANFADGSIVSPRNTTLSPDHGSFPPTGKVVNVSDMSPEEQAAHAALNMIVPGMKSPIPAVVETNIILNS